MPYNQATEAELKAFARAYAEARGLETVTSDDIRRDFGIQRKLAAHFGARPLGEIVDGAGRDSAADSLAATGAAPPAAAAGSEAIC